MLTTTYSDISTQQNDSIENTIWRNTDNVVVLVTGCSLDELYVIPLDQTASTYGYEPWTGREEGVMGFLRDEGFQRVVSGTVTLKVTKG